MILKETDLRMHDRSFEVHNPMYILFHAETNVNKSCTFIIFPDIFLTKYTKLKSESYKKMTLLFSNHVFNQALSVKLSCVSSTVHLTMLIHQKLYVAEDRSLNRNVFGLTHNYDSLSVDKILMLLLPLE